MDGASSSTVNVDPPSITTSSLKKLPEAIDEALFVHEKFCFIIDPSEQGARFLKYQTGSFVLADDISGSMNPKSLIRNLIGALQHGRTLTIKFPTLAKLNESLFDPELFPIEILDRMEFYKPEILSRLIYPNLGDPELEAFIPSQEFVFIMIVNEEFIPPHIAKVMHIIKVDDSTTNPSAQSEKSSDDLDNVASLYVLVVVLV